MRDSTPTDRSTLRTAIHRQAPPPMPLWRLRGATDDLRALAYETSFGYALGLELDTELVLLHLQPTLESLVAYADRIQTALAAHGWTVVDEPSTGRSRLHGTR
jgi:hypothetical protein